MTNFIKNVGVVILGCGLIAINLFFILGHDFQDIQYSVSQKIISPLSLFPPLSEYNLTRFIENTFPTFKQWRKESFQNRNRFRVMNDEGLLGYVYELQEDLRCPVCKNVRLLVGFDKEDRLINILLLEHLELSGDPMPPSVEQRFIQQFTSDQKSPPFVIGGNIDAISGATKSSRHIVNALNDLIAVQRVMPR